MDSRLTLGRRMAWMTLSCAVFVSVYEFCNWFTSQRAQVTSLHFAWERSLPLIPAFIYPYLSLAPLFAVSFLLCDRRQALRDHAQRILCALLSSALCYLFVPLRYGYRRPQVDDPFAAAFQLLHWLDRPFNEAPSLHIALVLILWPIFARRVERWTRRLLGGWFVLIAFSALFTHQHHVVGVLAGAVVALLSYWRYPLTPRSRHAALPRSPLSRRSHSTADRSIGAAPSTSSPEQG